MNPGRLLDPRLRALLEGGKRFAVLTHVSPDGDGLGSGMALFAHLRRCGKEARMIHPDPVPDHYRFLRLAPQVEPFDVSRHAAFVEDADGIFVLDNGSMARLGALEPHVRRARGLRVCIDHHETRDSGWDLCVVDEAASASGEIVFQLVEALGGEVDPEMAEALYVAIITDTGHFRFSKTRPETHRIAATLLSLGVRPDRIYERVYEGSPAGYVRLMGHALASMQADDAGLAWTEVDRELQDRMGATEEDIGGIVNTLLSVAGIRVAVLFKELAGGEIKVSLRSRGEIDVGGLAARQGGGGHRNAAGILLPGPRDAARRRVLEAVRGLLQGGGMGAPPARR